MESMLFLYIQNAKSLIEYSISILGKSVTQMKDITPERSNCM